MGRESPSVRQALAAAKTETALRIQFPEATVSEAGATLTPAASKLTPTLHVLAAKLTQAAPEQKYLAIVVDLDAPFPSFSVLSPALHGLQPDLVPGAIGADGFAPLETATGKEEWLVPYAGPGPPKPSGPHRYLFMIFEQPAGLDATAVGGALGLGPDAGLMARIRWDQEAVEKKLGLGEVLAGNYFLSRA